MRYLFFFFSSEWFHGVVGYHIILTWWGSPDRTRVEPFFFYYSISFLSFLFFFIIFLVFFFLDFFCKVRYVQLIVVIILERFHGVVGYHIILTWWGSPDRTRVKPFFFLFSPCPYVLDISRYIWLYTDIYRYMPIHPDRLLSDIYVCYPLFFPCLLLLFPCAAVPLYLPTFPQLLDLIFYFYSFLL